MIFPDWLNTFRILPRKMIPSTLDSKNASLNEYPACYEKAKRALYRLLETVKLVKIPSLQVPREAESHP